MMTFTTEMIRNSISPPDSDRNFLPDIHGHSTGSDLLVGESFKSRICHGKVIEHILHRIGFELRCHCGVESAENPPFRTCTPLRTTSQTIELRPKPIEAARCKSFKNPIDLKRRYRRPYPLHPSFEVSKCPVFFRV